MKTFLGLALCAAMSASALRRRGVRDGCPADVGGGTENHLHRPRLTDVRVRREGDLQRPGRRVWGFLETAEGGSDPGGPRARGSLRSGNDQKNQQERDESRHDAALRREDEGRHRPEKRGGNHRRRDPDRGGAGLQSRPHAEPRHALSPERGRERLYPDPRQTSGSILPGIRKTSRR